MIRLSAVINQFERDFLHQYAHRLLPSQRKALAAMKACRNHYSPLMQAHCDRCDSEQYFPHSCGNRHYPHCQHHESQQWLENQCRKQMPVNYFMITFTVPAQLRSLFFRRQRLCYGRLFEAVRESLQTFSQNDRKLKGTPGVVAVLHTHSRTLGYHPHIHAVIPAAAMNKENRLWREKPGKYLFNHKALPRGFRRARNYGFLHPNSKTLIRLLTLVFHFDPARFVKKNKPRSQLICACCGNPMQIVKTRIDRFTGHALVPV